MGDPTRPYLELGGMPLHEHVSCACGDEECEGHIRITVMADGRTVEVLTADGSAHVGVIVDADGAREISRIAAELLAVAEEERSNSATD
ncbi:MAG TPA: hypothetical protein VGM69_15370 [Chloroflexota bacterium]|jgi:hypothetical protein